MRSRRRHSDREVRGRMIAFFLPVILGACVSDDSGRSDRVAARVADRPEPQGTPDSLMALAEDAAPIGELTWIGRDTRGRVFAADRSDRDIKRYDVTGRFDGAIGGLGAGPGQFRDLTTVSLVGDTLTIFDFATKRLTVYSTDGSLLNSTSSTVQGATWTAIPGGLLEIRHPSRRGPLLALRSPEGKVRRELFARPRFVPPSPLAFHSATFAAVSDGVVFAGLFGDDSLFAFDLEGRSLGSAPLRHGRDVVPRMDVLLRQAGGRLQAGNGAWFHHQMPALMRIAPARGGRAIVQVARYDTKVGTHLADGGTLTEFGIVAGQLTELGAVNASYGVYGTDRDGNPLYLAGGAERPYTVLQSRPRQQSPAAHARAP
jgi:hypothetical protein